MDPFSITVGAVGLADTGTSLAKSLYGKVKSYKNAPNEIQEVAHDVETCTYMFNLLRSSVNANDANFTPEFKRIATNLVKKVQLLETTVELMRSNLRCRQTRPLKTLKVWFQRIEI